MVTEFLIVVLALFLAAACVETINTMDRKTSHGIRIGYIVLSTCSFWVVIDSITDGDFCAKQNILLVALLAGIGFIIFCDKRRARWSPNYRDKTLNDT